MVALTEITTETQTWVDTDPANTVEVATVKRVRHERGQPVHVETLERRYTVRASSKEASDRMWAIIEQTEAKLETIRAKFRQGP